MGKSTIGYMLEFLGVPVHDADMSVHDLMRKDKDTISAIKQAFPPSKNPDLYQKGHINRIVLGKMIFQNDEKRTILEQILHPRVHMAQVKFMASHYMKGTKIVALDIPLLFETGSESRVDYVLSVRAPAHIQRQRVLARPNMDEEKFQTICAKQMPSKDKERRSDYVIQTGIGRAYSMQQLKAMIHDIQDKASLCSSKERVEKYYTYS